MWKTISSVPGHNGMRRFLAVFLLALPITATTLWAADTQPAPDPAALEKAAAATMEKSKKTPLSWSCVFAYPTGAEVRADVLRSNGKRRIVVSAANQGKRSEGATVVERDGLWYVLEHDRAGKYRPYEAPFHYIPGYLFVVGSELRFFSRDMDLGRFHGREGVEALYRIPVPEQARRQFQGTAAQIERMMPTMSEEGRKKAQEQLAMGRRMMNEGTPIRVNTTTGVLSSVGILSQFVKRTTLEFPQAIDEHEFSVEGREWVDHSDDMTAGNRNDLAMIGYCGAWLRGAKDGPVQPCLMDVRTGRFRRVPFVGVEAQPGSFSKDRSKVYVAGSAGMEEGMAIQPYEIDLRSGRNRLLGANQLAGRHAMGPVLSPDGKTLAVSATTETLLQMQIYLIDVAAGEARKLGEPLDTAFPSWLPDGRGLILLSRRNVTARSQGQSTICRMDMDGKVTPLVEGDSPIVLGDEKTILFEEPLSGKWNTCDLAGRNIKQFGDGLPGFHQPASSPDGRQILMMRYDPDKGPIPMLIDMATKEPKPLKVPTGFWAIPAWR